MFIFFSLDNNEDKNSSGIKALTGLKSIIIPEKRLTKGLREFIIDDEDLTEDHLTNSLINLFKKQNIPDEFKEEWNHYSCISRSKVSSYLFLRNFQVRNIYSSNLRNILLQKKPVRDTIIVTVLNYFYEHMIFHYVAYPWIEAHYYATIKRKPILPFRAQEDRINKYIELLDDIKEELAPDNIAYFIDCDYALLCKYGRSIFEKYYEHKFPRGISNLAVGTTVIINLIRNIMLNYRGYQSLNKLSIAHILNIMIFMINRFSRNRQNTNSASFIPGLLSGKYTIDPRGFRFGKKALESHEKKFYSRKNKAEADLLWHITSRALFIKYLFDTHLTVDEIYAYFFFLNSFYAEWRPESVNVLDELFIIDDSMIPLITSIKNSIFVSKKSVYYSLLEVIQSTYNKAKGEYEGYLNDPLSGFPAALNCSYMHV